MWYEWFFDGIGTEIIVFILGALSGGGLGYLIGIRKNGSQKQKAKDNVEQEQELTIEGGNDNSSDGVNVENNFRQSQKAGNYAKQIQIGSIKHGNE